MIYVVIGFSLIVLIDLVPLIKQKRRKSIAVFSGMFAISLTLAVLMVYNIEPFSLHMYVQDLFKAIGLTY